MVGFAVSLLQRIAKSKLFKVYVISSKSQGKLYKFMAHRMNAAPASAGWHSEYVAFTFLYYVLTFFIK